MIRFRRFETTSVGERLRSTHVDRHRLQHRNVLLILLRTGTGCSRGPDQFLRGLVGDDATGHRHHGALRGTGGSVLLGQAAASGML